MVVVAVAVDLDAAGESVAVGSRLQLAKRDHCADMDPDIGTDAIAELGHQQGQPKHQAVAADEVEQRAVLPLEIDRQHRRLRELDEPGGEGFPGQLLGQSGVPPGDGE